MWGRIGFMAMAGLMAAMPVTAEDVGFIDRFKTIGPEWHVAEYDFDHDKFDTDWRRAHVKLGVFDGTDGLTLRLGPHEGGLNRFAGGSIRREDTSHYGTYEVQMRAASHPGVVTGFFTYTGSYYGTRHDEIDIEFLGKNTRQIHLAWFVDGALQNRFFDLGFDAATETATYAFEWRPNSLRWFVNGAEIYRHTDADGPIPQMPSRLFVNLWAADPSISIWAGVIDPKTRTQAQVSYVRFTPWQPEISSF